MSVELRELISKADLCEVEDRDEIAESIDEVRGMARWGGRSPCMECMELTEEEADRSGSIARGGLDIVSSGTLLLSDDSASAISGDSDKL
jgi:hypothetical protein